MVRFAKKKETFQDVMDKLIKQDRTEISIEKSKLMRIVKGETLRIVVEKQVLRNDDQLTCQGKYLVNLLTNDA